MKRRFFAALNEERCKWDRKLRDGSDAQCMRRRVDGEYCAQHAKMALDKGMTLVRINTPNTAHLYEIGTNKGRIEVEANTRTQAAKIAREAGYVVRDMNMVG